MQETFMAVYKHLDNINESSIKAYLAQTALNKSRDHLRKNTKLTKVPLDEISELSTEDNAVSSLLNDEIRIKLTTVISSLREPYRDVAKAYYLDGIPLFRYAADNNINPKTAQTRLRRAREKIKILFRKEYGDG